ncbi:paraquat-inducible protein A [Paraburkholderia acidisoli]|uniref:Paraquat-inducible protein A n=1 Tax=Paraburkholderia acidisoli TaxID=2571748 RepID=A0A7Z2GF46_9BURK|nr:paraquat-inducible protein A [Paraburkholderia acidisoli]QGZ60631.1 paraquat-inducible protein A [Paraburkholderia acidisoli]
MAQDKLIACHDCDALYHKPRLLGRQSARCPRCGATLYSNAAMQLDRICAMTVAALVTFIIAQSFPIIELDANGITTESSLFGALVVLWQENMQVVAVMVFCATVLFPLTEMVALLYVLLPVRRGYIPPGFNHVLRAIQFVRPWGMLEVFMLGVLITIVKMVSLARVIPETALFAFGALTLMFTVVVTFDSRTLWDIADSLRDASRAARAGGAGPGGPGSGGTGRAKGGPRPAPLPGTPSPAAPAAREAQDAGVAGPHDAAHLRNPLGEPEIRDPQAGASGTASGIGAIGATGAAAGQPAPAGKTAH